MAGTGVSLGQSGSAGAERGSRRPPCLRHRRMPSPSQFDATQFHPEFGYFAPTIRFRRKLALTLKGGALGVLVGAVAMFVVTMDREEKALTMLSTPVLTIPAPSAPAPSTPAPAPRWRPRRHRPRRVVGMPMSSKPAASAPVPSQVASPAAPASPRSTAVASGPASLTQHAAAFARRGALRAGSARLAGRGSGRSRRLDGRRTADGRAVARR